ncbi:MAG: hypothetical protein FJW35_11915 [Acidobacteria bacterium]|nr:hypothetical protein [Acidobacteriota bacterium]
MNPVFVSTALTGDPEKGGLKTAPIACLVEATKEIRPGGNALDVGAGMGRNALHSESAGRLCSCLRSGGSTSLHPRLRFSPPPGATRAAAR